MNRGADASVIRTDRWCCRAALVVEAMLVAWTGGRSAAGADVVDISVLVGAFCLGVVSLAVALAIHGWAVLGFGAPGAGSRPGG